MLERDYHDLTLAAYRAGLDGALWQEFANLLDDRLDGVWVSIYGHDLSRNVEPQTITTRYDGDAMIQYRDHYADRNLFIPALMRAPIMEINRSEVWVAEEELRKSELYSDFLRPREDIGTGGGGVLFNDDGRLLIMSGQVRFKDQEKADRMISMLRLLAPHVRQAFEMNRALQGRHLSGAGGRASFDSAQSALFLLGQNAKINDCNPASEILFGERSLVALDQSGALRFFRPTDQAWFYRAFREIEEIGRPGLNSATLMHDTSERPWVVRLTPIEARKETETPILDFVGSNKAIVLLSISPMDQEPQGLRDTLRSVCGLTASEAQLAEALFHGATLKNYAEENEITVHTVRSHLKSVFQKTGTHRQGELISFIHKLLH